MHTTHTMAANHCVCISVSLCVYASRVLAKVPFVECWRCLFVCLFEESPQFGDHLMLHAVPEWANKYVNYKGLKKMLKGIWAEKDWMHVQTPKKGLIPIHDPSTSSSPSSPKLAPKSHHKWDVLHLFDEDVRSFRHLKLSHVAPCSFGDPDGHSAFS